MRCQDSTLSTEITGVPCHGDTECADGIVYSLHRLPVVGATEIQNALTGLYTLQRLLVSRATVILNVQMELYNLYTDYWWLVPQRYRMR